MIIEAGLQWHQTAPSVLPSCPMDLSVSYNISLNAMEGYFVIYVCPSDNNMGVTHTTPLLVPWWFIDILLQWISWCFVISIPRIPSFSLHHNSIHGYQSLSMLCCFLAYTVIHKLWGFPFCSWTKRVDRLQLKFANIFLCYQHSSKSSIVMKCARVF